MDFIADLEIASSVDDDVYNKIVLVYSNTENSPVERAVKLNHIVSQGDSDNIKAVIRLFGFVTDTVIESRDYDDGLAELTNTVSELSSENEAASLGWKKITGRVDELEDYFIIKKIDSIKDRYSRVIDFQITTDIRPIFNMKRDGLNSEIYPYILKINTSDDNSFVCEFYDDSIDKIIEELELAKEKLKTIKENYGNR